MILTLTAMWILGSPTHTARKTDSESPFNFWHFSVNSQKFTGKDKKQSSNGKLSGAMQTFFKSPVFFQDSNKKTKNWSKNRTSALLAQKLPSNLLSMSLKEVTVDIAVSWESQVGTVMALKTKGARWQARWLLISSLNTECNVMFTSSKKGNIGPLLNVNACTIHVYDIRNGNVKSLLSILSTR